MGDFMEECIFCKIVKNEIPSKKVYEDASTVGFLDINPASLGHTIVIPKKHYSNIYDVGEDDLNKTIGIVKILAERIKNRLNADGVNVLQNNGRHAGQIVDHVHFHIIPRYENDDIMIKFPRPHVSEEDMKAVQDKLKEEEKRNIGTSKWI